MAAQQKSVSVNLMPRDAFATSTVGVFLVWALSIGRYIVIFTELIVILSFLSRFKLDRDLTDLNTTIGQQVAVIESYGDLEAEFRTLQNKLAFIRESNERDRYRDVVLILADVMPVDVRLTSMRIDDQELSLDGVALSSQGLARFVAGLKNQPSMTNLSLKTVSSGNSNDPGILFEISGEITGAARLE